MGDKKGSYFFIRRVDQLDAIVLDEELYGLLSDQFRKCFVYLPSNINFFRFGPELEVLFKFLYKEFALRNLRCSFGQSFFDLEYKDCSTLSNATNNQLRLLNFLTVILPWLWSRVIQKCCQFNDLFDALNRFDLYFQVVYKFTSLINFCFFLQGSSFLTLPERILNIKPVYSVSQEIRSLQYEGFNREFLWHGISEFLGFAVPLINIHRIKNIINQRYPKFFERKRVQQSPENYNCAICDEIPNFPHTIGCSHVFCYYCIASRLEADPKYFCNECIIETNDIPSLKPLDITKTLRL